MPLYTKIVIDVDVPDPGRSESDFFEIVVPQRLVSQKQVPEIKSQANALRVNGIYLLGLHRESRYRCFRHRS